MVMVLESLLDVILSTSAFSMIALMLAAPALAYGSAGISNSMSELLKSSSMMGFEGGCEDVIIFDIW